MTTPNTPDSNEALLPCPFCGSSDLGLSNGYDEDANWVVVCHGCKSSGTFCVEKPRAIMRWNTRCAATEGNVARVLVQAEAWVKNYDRAIPVLRPFETRCLIADLLRLLRSRAFVATVAGDEPRCSKCGHEVLTYFDGERLQCVLTVVDTKQGAQICGCKCRVEAGDAAAKANPHVDTCLFCKKDKLRMYRLPDSESRHLFCDECGAAGPWGETPEEARALYEAGRTATPPTTPSAAAMRAAEEIQDWNERGEGTGTHIGEVAHIAAIITRNLAATTSPSPETAVGGEAQRFVTAAFAYLDTIAGGDICNDRTCIRCRIADAAFEVQRSSSGVSK